MNEPSYVFPELETFEEAEFAARGYTPMWLSIFDRWLTEEEAGSSKLMSYGLAERSGLIARYQEQEDQFLSFYKSLFAAEDWRNAETPEALQTGFDAGAIDHLVRPSTREQKLMDVYLCGLRLRVVGGYDRTDLFLFEDATMIPHVSILASEHGLFMLR